MQGKVPTKLLVFLALIIFGVAGYFSYKQFQRHGAIRSEILVLEAERDRINKENESLKDRIGYFETESYQEQESKERLSMRKPDEYVVEIEQGEQRSETNQPSQEKVPETTTEEQPNYKKWFHTIFK